MLNAEYDVVVVGYGGAGGSAAVEAHDAGARVLILDKTAEGGGNTLWAGGNIRILRDADEAAEHFEVITEGTTDHDSVVAHARELTRLPEWIGRLGGVIEADNRGREENFVDEPPYCPREYMGSAFPTLPGASGLGGRYRWPEHDGVDKGRAVIGMLRRNVESRGIDVALGHRVSRLIRDSSGRVTGVSAHDGTSEVHIGAKSGVVLSCGGYGWDPTLQRDYLGVALPSSSPPLQNTGDGVRMAMAIGADMWHMNAAVLQFGIVVPTYEASFMLRVKGKSFIIVDQLGHRFTDETRLAGHDARFLLENRHLRTGKRLRLPSFLIFDDATRRAGTVVGLDRGFNRGADWSPDNSREIERGWISSGADAKQLGHNLDIDGSELSETVAAYNRGLEAESDEFGRSMRDAEPLEGPLFGIPLWPCIVNTQGGPRRTHEGRVLDPFGDVIDGLFGAGELGSIWNTMYPGGGNFGEALTSGRVAGRTAAIG